MEFLHLLVWLILATSGEVRGKTLDFYKDNAVAKSLAPTFDEGGVLRNAKPTDQYKEVSIVRNAKPTDQYKEVSIVRNAKPTDQYKETYDVRSTND